MHDKANSKRIHCHADDQRRPGAEYSRQALAVLDMWMNPAPDDEMESFRVAAVHSLVSQASEYLVKVREVRP
jgi:hypothetical protein